MEHRQNTQLWRWVLAAMFVPLLLIAYWPTPVDRPFQDQLSSVLNLLHAHGIPAWFDSRFVEAAANVALFLPLGLIAALAFPDKRWWQIGALGLLMSGCIELGQYLFLHDRFASATDIMTNTSGAVVGALLATGAVNKQRARRPPRR